MRLLLPIARSFRKRKRILKKEKKGIKKKEKNENIFFFKIYIKDFNGLLLSLP